MLLHLSPRVFAPVYISRAVHSILFLEYTHTPAHEIPAADDADRVRDEVLTMTSPRASHLHTQPPRDLGANCKQSETGTNTHEVRDAQPPRPRQLSNTFFFFYVLSVTPLWHFYPLPTFHLLLPHTPPLPTFKSHIFFIPYPAPWQDNFVSYMQYLSFFTMTRVYCLLFFTFFPRQHIRKRFF